MCQDRTQENKYYKKSKNKYLKSLFDNNRNNTTLLKKGNRQLITLNPKEKFIQTFSK